MYGVLAYSVEQRTRELGIRMAIGADRGRVRSMVLWDGVRLVVIGLAIGIAGAGALSGVLASQLYVPAWRATQVDPLIAMRAD